MRDVADISSAFLRNGAAFVAIAIIAATTLAANASSAPLARAWRDVDDDLLEVGYAINRWLGGVSGSARGPNILFTPSQTIRGVWESSSEPVFTVTSSDGRGHYMRGATYDSFDGTTWQQLDRQSILVDQGADLLGGSVDRVSTGNGRHEITITVVPADYGGDVIVAPDSVNTLDQPAEIQLNGPGGPFVAAKLVYGIQPGVAYSATSLVRVEKGAGILTGNALASAGTAYPAWVAQRYLAIRPGSLGQIVTDTANEIRESLPENRRTPFHLAVAVQDYLFRSGGFQYNTDVRNLCEPGQRRIDCFLETKQGYCEYFATAMVMLLRELGVPARYVLGYLPGQEQDDGSYLVDRSAGHAWVEAFFPGYGWVRFDPTPGNQENGQEITVIRDGPPIGPAPSVRDLPGGGELECETEGNCEDGVLPDPVNPDRPVPVAPATQDWTPLALVGAVFLLLFVVAVWYATKRTTTTAPDLAYRGITRIATRLGYGPRPAQTVYEYAAGLGELVPVARDDLGLIATAKVEATYGRRDPGESMMRTLAAAYRRVRLGLLRLVIRRPNVNLRPRGIRGRRGRDG